MFSTEPRLQQPLASSRSPVKNIRMFLGSIQRNQRKEKVRITRKRITHPHTDAITDNALCKASDKVIWVTESCLTGVLSTEGIRLATRSALSSWIIQSIHAYPGDGNCDATMPKRNAGPALLQKQSIRWACIFDSCPVLYAAATHWAPTGYPPRKPVTKSVSLPSGIRQILPRGRSMLQWIPDRDPVMRMDRIKKGKSEGITVCMHSVIPSCAPCRAVFPSRIKSSIPIAAQIPEIKFLLFKSLTSEESMLCR